MSANAARDKYVEKVRKLLTKAEGASTPEEAEAFFAKVTELMTEWEITESELREGGPTAAVITHRINLSSYTPVADCHAISFVASVFDIIVGTRPYSPGYPAQAVMVGRSDDIDRFLAVWPMVELQMIRFMKNEERPGLSRGAVRKYRQSFKIGFSRRIADRMRIAKMATIQASGSTALVLVKQDVQDAASEQFGRGRKSNIQLSSRDMAAGAAAANSADLGQRGVRVHAS